MIKGSFLPELPCEKLVRKICGNSWRNLGGKDLNGAWGVAIVKSVIDGVEPNLDELSSHLGVEKDRFRRAYNNLDMNGVFFKNLDEDQGLIEEDTISWCYYAGYASGAIGPYLPKNDRRT